LVVTFTDAPTLALFDPTMCNTFQVHNTTRSAELLLGFVRVTVSTSGLPRRPLPVRREHE
jgi:hypothetical protein